MAASNVSLAIFLFLAIQIINARNQAPKVSIPKLGSIRGSFMVSAIKGRQFASFRRIPYARPPNGDLRFQDPLPVEAWNDQQLDATKEGQSCLQFDTFNRTVYGDEDCLVLNVYTPNIGESDVYPVMVWIHGGGFIRGDGNGEKGLYGPEYFLDRDVVLVTLNYRLGPFGFLSTGDKEAPGNYGLLDQVLALKWIKEHIEHFGGNQDSITIFGESAGGACVEFHLLSPHSKGLFHRAIAQSGASTATWAVHDNVYEWTMLLAQDLNCPTKNKTSLEILACLRKADANSLAEFRKKIALPYAYELFPLAFGPRIDQEREKPFLPAHPLDLMADGKFSQVPYITGVTKNEGIILTSTLIGPQNQRTMKAFQGGPISAIRHFLSAEKRHDGKEKAQLVHDKYLSTSQPYANQIRELEQLSSDSAFFKPLELSVNLLSSNSDQPVYAYFYCYTGTFSYYSIIGAPDDPFNGVGHGDELMFMFGNNLADKLQSPGDLAISETLIDLFTSFASNGTPTSGSVEWSPYSANKKRYLQIGGELNEMKTFTKLIDGEMPFHERMAFWDDILHPNRSKLLKVSNRDEL